MAYTVETYPFLIMEIMEYIKEVKTKEPQTALVDIIVDFSKKQNIDLELLGDAISEDEYLKLFIEKDCVHHEIFRKPTDIKTTKW